MPPFDRTPTYRETMVELSYGHDPAFDDMEFRPSHEDEGPWWDQPPGVDRVARVSELEEAA